jgi:hypothetical protein
MTRTLPLQQEMTSTESTLEKDMSNSSKSLKTTIATSYKVVTSLLAVVVNVEVAVDVADVETLVVNNVSLSTSRHPQTCIYPIT